MFKIDENYSDCYGVDATKYPGGMAVNSSGVDTTDGTPWLAKMFNNCIGWMQALYIKAFGSLAGISNDAENARTSDVVRALEKIQTDNNAAERATSEAAYFKKSGGVIGGNVDIGGQLTAKGTTIDGALRVTGDFFVDGTGKEVVSTELEVGADTITIRKDNPTGLAPRELAGVITENYDGSGKNNILAVDADGNARVGDIDVATRLLYSNDGTSFYEDEEMTVPATIGQDEIVRDTGNTASGGAKIFEGTTFSNDDTEAIATRADETEMSDAKLTKWNAAKKRIETTPYSFMDIAELIEAVREMHTLGDLDNHNGVLAAIPRWLRFNPQNKKGLIIKAKTIVKVGSRVFSADADTIFDLTDDLTTGGKDYFIFLRWSESSGDWTLSASLTKSADNDTSRCIGRLHTLCAAVPSETVMTVPAAPSSVVINEKFLFKAYTDEDLDFKTFYTKKVTAIASKAVYDTLTIEHPLAGFAAGDILPESIWCLTWRPRASVDDAMVYDVDSDAAIDVYLQSGKGQLTRSAYGATTTRSRQQQNHEADLLAVGKRLLSDEEFASAALGSNERTSIQGTSEASAQTTGGHVDTASRRMISAIGCEDMCGAAWQWLRDVSAIGSSGWATYDGAGFFGQTYGASSALIAGGDWGDGSSCGSRARSAHDARSHADADHGGRGSSRVIRGA